MQHPEHFLTTERCPCSSSWLIKAQHSQGQIRDRSRHFTREREVDDGVNCFHHQERRDIDLVVQQSHSTEVVIASLSNGCGCVLFFAITVFILIISVPKSTPLLRRYVLLFAVCYVLSISTTASKVCCPRIISQTEQRIPPDMPSTAPSSSVPPPPSRPPSRDQGSQQQHHYCPRVAPPNRPHPHQGSS